MDLWTRKKTKKKEDDDDFDMDDIMERNMAEVEKIMKSMMGGFGFSEEDMKRMPQNKLIIKGSTIKIGPDGKVQVEEFGNVEPGKKPVVKNEREPLIDILDKEDKITVLAELPGVEKHQIKLDLEEGNTLLVIDVPGKFHKELKLPAKVKEMPEATYKNGVLEIELTKTEKARKTTIKVK
jgi:HSP20 family protein